MVTPTKGLKGLFSSFLEVCNTALEQNRESFPYKQILALSEKVFGDRNIAVSIYEDEPKKEQARFVIRYADGRFDPVGPGGRDTAFSVKLSRGYMEQVVRNRREYIEHPEKLDWDWLKSRLGFTSATGAAPSVKEVMTRGFRPVACDATLREAAKKMKDLDVGALPVLDGQTLVGMVTDRDITVRATAEGMNPDQTPVRRVMTPAIVSCGEEVPINEAAEIMEDLKVRRLLVVDAGGHPVGIVSVGDFATRSPSEQLTGEVMAKVCGKPVAPAH